MRYLIEERTFMVKKYYELKSSGSVQKAWRKEFQVKLAPSIPTILSTVSKFEKTGSVQDSPPIPKKINEERELAKNDPTDLIAKMPHLSIRKAACVTGMPYGSVQCFLKEDLHLKPYKEQEFHQLIPSDCPKRVEFAKLVLSLPKEDFFFISAMKLIFTSPQL